MVFLKIVIILIFNTRTDFPLAQT